MIDVIAFILENIPLCGLILAIAIGLLRCGCPNVRQRQDRMEGFLAYTLLLAVGVSGIWGFIIHAFFPSLADKAIGWPWSPFEFEVAVANLGMGLTGLFAFNASRGFRLATILFASCFGWGAAGGHIYQMIAAHNYHADNAGIILYTDILIPLLLWIFYFGQGRQKSS